MMEHKDLHICFGMGPCLVRIRHVKKRDVMTISFLGLVAIAYPLGVSRCQVDKAVVLHLNLPLVSSPLH